MFISYKNRSKILACLFLGVLMSVSWLGIAVSQTVSEGFSSDVPIQRGMLVAIKSDKDRKIEPLTGQNIDKMRGVVINKNDSPVTLSTESEQVFVADSGTHEVIVSGENGDIKQGDYISISSLAGIGTKAGNQQSIVLGRAATSFDSKTGSLGAIESGGKTLQISRVPVNIAIGKNPLQKAEDANNVPEILAKASRGIAKRDVSLPRVYLAFTLLIITSLISGTLLYGAVKGSLISIGRNPLSKSLIIKNLVQVVLTSFIIFILGLFAVYLILRL